MHIWYDLRYSIDIEIDIDIYMFTYLRSGLVGRSGSILSSGPPNCSCQLRCEVVQPLRSFFLFISDLSFVLRSDGLGWFPLHWGQSPRMINLCHFGSRLKIDHSWPLCSGPGQLQNGLDHPPSSHGGTQICWRSWWRRTSMVGLEQPFWSGKAASSSSAHQI
jgi:hypothetical protein